MQTHFSAATMEATRAMHRDTPMRIVIVGHVDHGKSTLIGRLFHDTGTLPEGRLEAIQASCERRGVPFEWAFLMDALQSERDQNITIDSAQIWFASAARRYVIIDAPGHLEFLKNMITGAASAEAAVIMVAADEGIRDQSRRHGVMLSLLGIREVIVAVNKLDAVGYDGARFAEIAREYGAFLGTLNIRPRLIVPISAREGDNVVTASGRMPFWSGPTLLGALDGLPRRAEDAALPLRFAVQDVYRFDARRIIAGRIEAGVLRVGDRIRFHPGGETQTVARIEAWSETPATEAYAGESIGITLADQLFVERGHVATHEDAPPLTGRRLKASLFWMGREALRLGGRYRLKLLSQEVDCEVEAIVRTLDIGGGVMDGDGSPQREVERHGVAEIVLATRSAIAFDCHDDVATTGRFVLVDGYDIAGGGIITGVPEDAPMAGLTAAAGPSAILDAENVARLKAALVEAATDSEAIAAVALWLGARGIQAVALD